MRNKRLLSEAKMNADSIDLLSLSWRNFEYLVGEALRQRGFSVTETPEGPDGDVKLALREPTCVSPGETWA